MELKTRGCQRHKLSHTRAFIQKRFVSGCKVMPSASCVSAPSTNLCDYLSQTCEAVRPYYAFAVCLSDGPYSLAMNTCEIQGKCEIYCSRNLLFIMKVCQVCD